MIGDHNTPGASLPVLTNPATPENILQDKKAFDGEGNLMIGTMPNNGNIDVSLNCGQNYTLNNGYYTGGTIRANSLASQTVANATAGHILKGETAWVNGIQITGTMTVNSFLSFSAQPYSGRQILLKWQNPSVAAGKPLSGIIIKYGTGTHPAWNAGTTIYTGNGGNTTPGGWAQAIVTMPADGTTYYFTAFSYVTTSMGQLNGPSYGASILKSSAATAIAEQWLIFTSSRNYTIPAGFTKMDAFCVGGGGCGGKARGYSTGADNGGGGGGGYTNTITRNISSGNVLIITVGAGMLEGNSGLAGTSSISLNGSVIISANGGQSKNDNRSSDGGSGGGSGSGWYDGNSGYEKKSYAQSGGSDGSDSQARIEVTGKGQHRTTRAYGKSTGTLYSGGGGGGGFFKNYGDIYNEDYGRGGVGGGGDGAYWASGDGLVAWQGKSGGANTGGGGGGAAAGWSSSANGGSGGSGIVLIHLYR